MPKPRAPNALMSGLRLPKPRAPKSPNESRPPAGGIGKAKEEEEGEEEATYACWAHLPWPPRCACRSHGPRSPPVRPAPAAPSTNHFPSRPSLLAKGTAGRTGRRGPHKGRRGAPGPASSSCLPFSAFCLTLAPGKHGNGGHAKPEFASRLYQWRGAKWGGALSPNSPLSAPYGPLMDSAGPPIGQPVFGGGKPGLSIRRCLSDKGQREVGRSPPRPWETMHADGEPSPLRPGPP